MFEFRNCRGGLIDLATITDEMILEMPDEVRGRFEATLHAQKTQRGLDALAGSLAAEIKSDQANRETFFNTFAPRFRRTRMQEVRQHIAMGRPYLRPAVAFPEGDHVTTEAAADNSSMIAPQQPTNQDEFIAQLAQRDSDILAKQNTLRSLSIEFRKACETTRKCERELMSINPPMTHRECVMDVSRTTALVKSGALPTHGREYTALSYLDALGNARNHGDSEDFARSRFRNGGYRRGASPYRAMLKGPTPPPAKVP